MVKKIIYSFSVLLVIALLILLFYAGKNTDKSMNIRNFEGVIEVSDHARALHKEINIADWHSDNLLWDRDMLDRHDHGHVDLPRLLEGNFTLQVFDAVVQSPKGQNYNSNTGDTDNITLLSVANRWPMRTWNCLTDRTIHQAEILHDAAARSEQLSIVKSSDDLQSFLNKRSLDQNQVAGLLSIEGLHAIEGKIENLDRLYNAGYRMMGLVHFFDNKIGGSSAGVDKGPLTPLGIEVLKKMEEKKIIVDLAHASPALISDVLDRATRPVVISHGGAKGVNNSLRNLSDEELLRIKANGGIIGLGFWAEAAGGILPSEIAQSIKYVVDKIGIEHVSLGSDWDGSVITYFDASQIILLTQALIDIGFSDDEIKMIMGGNQIRFLLENLA